MVENSRFFQLNESAITMNSPELIRDLTYCKEGGLIDDELNLIYFDNPEEMERSVRTIVACDLLFNCLGGSFHVLGVPKDKVEELEWFVRLFAYLESESSLWELNEDDKVYPPSEDCKKVFANERIHYIVDISELRFLYDTIKVEIN